VSEGQSRLCEHGHTDPMTNCNQCEAREIEGTVSPSPEQSGELVKRLRLLAGGHRFDAVPVVTEADALESAQAEIARLTAALERVEEIITAWAYAYDIDGAVRNELFCRLRAALAQGNQP
jgi:hypothetical protein